MDQTGGKVAKEKRARYKLGEMLVRFRVISEAQLEEALNMQRSFGGRLGRNLIQLNHITEDVFIKFLSGQLGIDSVNLKAVEIPPDVQRLVPLDTVRRLGVLPVRRDDNTLYLGMTDPTDRDAIRQLEFSLGVTITPLVLAESQWEFALAFFRDRGWGTDVLTKRVKGQRQLPADYDLRALVRELIHRKGSGIHLSVEAEPTFRVNDTLVRLPTPHLTAEKLDALLAPILTPQQKRILEASGELDFAYTFAGLGRFRFNVYRQKNRLAAALRYIAERIPTLEELAIPSWLPPYVQKKQGLILIAAPSGHGTSTTLACLVDIINATRRVNIVTIEDPIEYVHHHNLSNVNQREIGTDTESFGDGMRHIFRQDPDVICIGEMRDLESLATALTAAETGHLVLGTLHANSAIQTIDRIIDVFPSGQQNQVRSQLASSLLVIFSQRLVPRADGAGRILAYEKLANSYRVQNAIRENRTYLIRSQSAVNTEDYSAIELRLAELVRKGLVTYEEGLRFAEDAKLFESLCGKR